jgi:hypothetical protein
MQFICSLIQMTSSTGMMKPPADAKKWRLFTVTTGISTGILQIGAPCGEFLHFIKPE